MEARPCQILEFFNGTKQSLIPLFQRPYEWEAHEWEALWGDLLEQYERSSEQYLASHFTGAIVTAPATSVPVGVSKYLVIDGQQRLTTIAILLCAMRSFFDHQTVRFRKLSKLLVNEDDDGLDYYKLLPTQPDRPAFQALIDGNPIPGSRFLKAFQFFRNKLQGKDSDGNVIDIERFTEVVQTRLTVVSIHLGDVDDPYLVFESLNAKGVRLTQADLIRNYLLLRLHSSDQQRIYETAWLPMQSLLKDDHLTEFMRQYLMLNGEEVLKSSIYAVLKKNLLAVEPSAVISELDRMQSASVLYADVVGLTTPQNTDIAKRLSRLRRWEVATANPFILKLLLLHLDDVVPESEVIACLSIIESFVVRRTICNVPTNQLKRIFLSLAKGLPVHDVSSWLSETLAAGASGRRWPKDPELKDELGRYRAYAQPIDRCKFLLESIEESYDHKEGSTFSAATIEHVMPQALTEEWRVMLGASAEQIHAKWSDLLGNLTLTAYNSPLSNSPFAKKREILANSHFEMNRRIARNQTWTEQELIARSDELFAKIRQVWPRPA